MSGLTSETELDYYIQNMLASVNIIEMRRNTPCFSYGDISRPFFFAKFLN